MSEAPACSATLFLLAPEREAEISSVSDTFEQQKIALMENKIN